MRKSFGDDVALRHPLQGVIADLIGSVDCFFQVTSFKDLHLALSVMSPNAGQVIGL